ncbi:MAG: histone deacetylase [Deltaproteobacteria bacterium]|nr:histone deacetylase [Deltaproteobacteria bacterium]MBW2417034.1 histone deacetylase [Deltaproteobacteria bacterium]
MDLGRPILVSEDARFREHVAPRGHPECPERLLAVEEALASFQSQHAGALERIALRPADESEILRVHRAEHLQSVEAAVLRAPAQLDPDTFVSPESGAVARLAAGSIVDLALRVASSEGVAGFGAVRPPGHHAESGRAMGFCLFNNVAIAARALQHEQGIGKLLILDWDVHHGNGTQHSFEDDPSILYVSTHQFPFYPGTGNFGEAGTGAGLGSTVNVPLPAGSGDLEYLGAFQRILVPVAECFRPEMILVSCGFDAHDDDPLASMRVSRQGYLDMTRIVRNLAERLCEGRLCFVLEGGYSPTGLREGTLAVLEGLREDPSGLPSSTPEMPAGSPLRGVVDQVVRVHGSRYPGLGAA